MFTRSILSIITLALAAGAAHAQTARDFSVVASVPEACALQQPVLSSGSVINFRGLNGTTLQVDELTDPRTLSTRAASASVSFGVTCSTPHNLRVESENNGLWRSATATIPPGFADAVPYRAEITWGELTGQLQADALSRRANQLNITVNRTVGSEIDLRLNIQQGASNGHANAPLIAGVYQDTIRVTVEPQ